MFACEIHDLRHLCLGDFVGEYPTLADPVIMHVQHDLRRGLDVLLEELFQHQNDELHRRVIVVQDQDAVQIGPFRLRLDFGDD